MWRLLELIAGRRSDVASAGDNSSFHVYRVRFPDRPADIISLLPEDVVFASGLAPEIIVGGFTNLLGEGEPMAEADFRPNRRFREVLHDVIAMEVPKLPGFVAEARRQHAGWVYLIDARTPTPAGDVPPCDILGRFEVREGTVVPGSYEPNANHVLFSSNGLFKLEPALHDRLVERLMEYATASQHDRAQALDGDWRKQ